MGRESRSTDSRWWILAWAGGLSLLFLTVFAARVNLDVPPRISWIPFVLLAVLGVLVRTQRVPLSPREFALVGGGFLLPALQLSPAFFYTVGSDQVPRPYAAQVVDVVEVLFYCLPLWWLLNGVLLGRKWWLLFSLRPCKATCPCWPHSGLLEL